MYNDVMMLVRYLLMIGVGNFGTQYMINGETQELIVALGLAIFTVGWRLVEKYWEPIKTYWQKK